MPYEKERVRQRQRDSVRRARPRGEIAETRFPVRPQGDDLNVRSNGLFTDITGEGVAGFVTVGDSLLDFSQAANSGNIALF